MKDKRYIGSNEIVIEGDLVTIDKQREWTENLINELLALFAEILRKEGRLFVITVPDRKLTVTAAARRRAAEWFNEHDVVAIALVNASVTSRAVAALTFGAVNLFARKPLNIRNCVTIDEARAFIDEERVRHFGV